MSSLDMVAYINSTREPGKPEVRHDNFLAKVPTVLGFSASPKFLGQAIVPISNGATRTTPVYNFPRREAMLMAMSYSYKLQATVFDAWEAAEAKLAAQAPVAPPTALQPADLVVSDTDGVQTMSSLDMVAYINSTRKPGEAELRHADFLAKVPTVLNDSTKFSAQYIDPTGRPLPCYNFPRREATFMAMSYSYELQQKVSPRCVAYDA